MSAIRLFRCMRCHGVVDENEVACSCGGKMFSEGYVTKGMVWRYLLSHPKQLWRMILDGGFKRQSEPPKVGGPRA